MSYDPTLFNVDPYYDDFNEDKKFLRIMFKPGYALQAREVTQMQTILQKQIERFGSNIFENGSVVLDGQITENYLRYGRITGLTGVSAATGLIGAVVGDANSAQARIVHAENGLTSTVDGYPVVYFEYLGGGAGFTSNTTISGTAGTNSVSFSLSGNSTVSALGDATVISVNSGVRFIDGYFVMHDAQMIGAATTTGSAGSQYRVFNNPTTRIGFATNPSFVTASDDETLNDPAFGYYNYAAPGADRFKLDLQLTQYGFDPTAVTTTTNFARGDFMEIVRIVDGQTVKKELYPEYAVLEDTLARRTYDESGNYTVEPFDLNLTYRDAGGANTSPNLSAELGQGKAYIFGYEFETQGTSVLSIPRARSTSASYTDQRSIGSIGPSLLVSPGGSASSLTGFDLESNPVVFLSDGATTAPFNNIGTARIRALIPSGANYKAYIYDIAMTGAFTLANPTRIFVGANAIQGGATAQQAFNINWNGATGVLNDINDSGLLYILPKGDRIGTISNVNYATLNVARVAVGANGSCGTFNTGGANRTYARGSVGSTTPITNANEDFFVLSTTGAPVGFTASFNPTTNQSFTLTANASNQNVYVFYTTDMGGGSAYNRRKKTLVTETITGITNQFQVDPLTGRNFLYIGKGLTSYVDVVSVSSITGTLGGVASQQVLNYFTLDNGQRDNYYDWSRLLLGSNVTPGSGAAQVTGPYDVTLIRFQHGNDASITGPFTVNSYLDGGVDYKDIPVYISPTTGRSYRLSDVLDFRPVRQNDGTFSGYVVPAQSSANDNKFSYSAYLPRTDKIVLGRDRNFKVLSGIPSTNPQPPADDPDAMTLYTVTLNGYTTTKDDVQIKRIENKRYTMQDIASLEDRLDNVEYYSNLNLLEQQVRNSPILDSNGLEIPKKGILVDGFRGHAVSDVQDPMYAASIDFENAEMRPSFRNRVYRLNQVSSASSVSGSADGIYTLGYTTSPLINQPLATSSLNINPAGVFNYLGFMRSTPASDFWYDDTNAPIVRVNTEGENDAWLFGNASGTGAGEAKGFGSQWNDWESNWSGIARNNISTSSASSDPSRSIFVTSAGSRLVQPSFSSSVLPNSLVNNTGDLQVKTDIIPYARSIAIGLSASNMRPNTGLYLFVDGLATTPSSGGGGITSDAAGNASVTFTIPVAKLAAGKKSIRLTDSSTNDLTKTTTAVDYIFPAQGTWGNFRDGIISTRTVQTRRESVRSEKIVTNIFGKNIQRSGFTKLLGYTDPLSQSFFVDPAIYPSGIFAKKVTLYFKSKDGNASTPITMVLRPIISGYPHPSKFIPLSDVTILASSVTTSNVATAGTDFEFSSPVYLAPGEYAFSLVTPSNNFEVFTSQVGLDVIKQSTTDSTVRATKQPYARSLFKNQTSTGIQKTEIEDVKFLLHICKFNNSLTPSFKLGAAGATFYGSGSLKAHTVRYNIPFLAPANTALTTSETGLVGSSVDLNKTIVLPSGTQIFNGSSNNFTQLSFNMSTSDPYVSPVIDIDRANTNVIENKINNADFALSGETGSTNLGAAVGNRATARYITKRVVLEPGMEATNLRVEMLASYPNETSFKVYARMSPENGTGLPFDLRGYTEMTPASTYPNTTVSGYQEMAFKLTGQPKFRVFAIKIVMTSTDGTVVPRFKNLRITAA